eukprot:jgi/Chlat1/8693/Chrsp88S08083
MLHALNRINSVVRSCGDVGRWTLLINSRRMTKKLAGACMALEAGVVALPWRELGLSAGCAALTDIARAHLRGDGDMNSAQSNMTAQAQPIAAYHRLVAQRDAAVSRSNSMCECDTPASDANNGADDEAFLYEDLTSDRNLVDGSRQSQSTRRVTPEELLRRKAVLEDDMIASWSRKDAAEEGYLRQIVRFLEHLGAVDEADAAALDANSSQYDGVDVEEEEDSAEKAMRLGFRPIQAEDVPPSFVCPISMDIMVDPVVIKSTLQTCERSNVQAWLEDGNDSCPVTGAKLMNFELMPNLALRDAIAEWAQANKYILPDVADATALANGRANHNPIHHGNGRFRDPITYGVHLLRHGSPWQKEAAARVLCKLARNNDNKVIIALEGAVTPLVELLRSTSSPQGQEAAAAALCNLCDKDANNKVEVAREGAIPPLVSLLRHGLPTVQEVAAEALRNLSAYNAENTVIIAREGAIPPLVGLLKKGGSGGKEAAALALANLALNTENKVIIGKQGAIPLLVRMLKRDSADGRAAAANALCNLSFNNDSKAAIAKAGAVAPLKQLLTNGTDLGKRAAALALRNLGVEVS